jgi:hypothetical protein
VATLDEGETMEEYAVDVDVDNSVAKVTDIRYWQ